MLPLPLQSQGGFKLPLPPSPPKSGWIHARVEMAPTPAEVRSMRKAAQLVKCKLLFQLEGKIFLSVCIP